MISHAPRLILQSKCSITWTSQISHKQVFAGERKQVIGLLLGWRTVLQADSILPTTRNVSLPSEKPHHHRRSDDVSLPFCPVCPHNAVCSWAFLSYPQKKSDRFALHLWDRLRPQALAYWYEMTGLIAAAGERNPAQLSQEIGCTTSAVVGFRSAVVVSLAQVPIVWRDREFQTNSCIWCLHSFSACSFSLTA